MRKVIIMRGIPGSGKSTRAREILKQYRAKDKSVLIVSADHYFEDGRGNYSFNPRFIGDAHRWCYNTFTLKVTRGINLVIVDNTNTQLWEYKRYVDFAEEAGYEVEIEAIVPDNSKIEEWHARCIHGVPLDKIEANGETLGGINVIHTKISTTK